MSRIGIEIKRIRTEKGLTPKQLAKAIGASEGFVLDVEAGKKVLSDEHIARVSKALNYELGMVGLFSSEQEKVTGVSKASTTGVRPGVKTPNGSKPVVETAIATSGQPQSMQEVWNEAFGSVLKTVPVYDYKIDTIIDKKQLPITSNKVEGFPKEKVFYLEIQGDDMAAFRISKGDRAFSYLTNEVDKEGFYFVEYNGSRAVRQIKKLLGDKLLLISNKGTLVTETIEVKSLKVLARLVRLEIVL